MTDDRMEEAKAKARANLAPYNAERDRLIAKYQKALTLKAQLLALAKIIRHHSTWMNSNMFTSGWVADSVTEYAKALEKIAKDL